MGRQSFRLVSPAPHSTERKEKPPPPGAAPTPAWAVHSVVFSSPPAQGATGRGRGPPSVSAGQQQGPGSVGPSRDPQFVPFVFLKDSTQPYQSHRPIRNISPKVRN